MVTNVGCSKTNVKNTANNSLLVLVKANAWGSFDVGVLDIDIRGSHVAGLINWFDGCEWEFRASSKFFQL